MRRLSVFFLCFFLLFSSSACDRMVSFEIPFLKGEKKETKKKEATQKKKKSAQKEAPAEAPQETPSPPAETAPESKQEAPSVEVPAPATPEPATPPPAQPSPLAVKEESRPTGSLSLTYDPSIPLKPLEHFGGLPTSLAFEQNLLFAGFGRRLVIYDGPLATRGSLLLAAPLLKMRLITETDGGKTLYLHEEKNVLEIVHLPSEGKPVILKSFEADGPFDGAWPIGNNRHLFVFFPDRIQMIDVGDIANIRTEADIPIGGASQILPNGNYLYVIHGDSMNVVDRVNRTVVSSIPLGKEMKLLGIFQDQEKEFLIAAARSSRMGPWESLQLMPLIKGGGGISDLGKGVDLPSRPDEVVIDPGQPIVALVKNGVATLFDLKKRETIAEAAFPLTGLDQMVGGGGAFYAASEKWLARSDYRMETTTAPATGTSTDGTPLAATPTSSPTVKWEADKKIAHPGRIEKVFLPAAQSLLVTNALSQDDPELPPFFFTNAFLSGADFLTPLAGPEKGSFHLTQAATGPDSLLLYDEIRGKIYSVKRDLSSIQEVAIPAQAVVGMAVGFDGSDKTLTIAVTQKDGRGEEALQAYSLGSSGGADKISSLTVPGISGVVLFDQGRQALVGCGKEGLCVVDVATNRAEMKLTLKVTSPRPDAIARELTLSPDGTLAYVFFENPSGPSIALYSLAATPPSLQSEVKDLAMTPSQFRGMTFASGGQKAIFPVNNGLRVYDVKNPKNPTLAFHWMGPQVFSADITDRGKKLCLALGSGGLECSEWVP